VSRRASTLELFAFFLTAYSSFFPRLARWCTRRGYSPRYAAFYAASRVINRRRLRLNVNAIKFAVRSVGAGAFAQHANGKS